MEFYEIALVIHPNYSDQLVTVLKPYINFVTKNDGVVHALEDWGRIKLSYPIEKLHKAHYILIKLHCKGTIIVELKEMLRYDENIIRHLIMKMKSFTEGHTIMAKDNIEETNKLLRELNIKSVNLQG